MIIKLVKFRDILSNRIKAYGGEKDPCVKAGAIKVQMEDEDLIIESITGYGLTSEVYINVRRRKK